jgi:hypothetical protein
LVQGDDFENKQALLYRMLVYSNGQVDVIVYFGVLLELVTLSKEDMSGTR